MTEAPVQALREAIRNLHGCEADFVQAVPVVERWEGSVLWEGVVSVFDLQDHPTAKRAYAWSFGTEEGRRRFVAVLHEGPVDSPLAAVRALLVSEIRKKYPRR